MVRRFINILKSSILSRGVSIDELNSFPAFFSVSIIAATYIFGFLSYALFYYFAYKPELISGTLLVSYIITVPVMSYIEAFVFYLFSFFSKFTNISRNAVMASQAVVVTWLSIILVLLNAFFDSLNFFLGGAFVFGSPATTQAFLSIISAYSCYWFMKNIFKKTKIVSFQYALVFLLVPAFIITNAVNFIAAYQG